MLAQGLVLLSAQDTDAPDLPAICTVSKDDVGDDGGYALGMDAAAQGALWCDRPYFTGNPSVDWLVVQADRVTHAGGYAQLGNEQNLVLEGWSGGPTAWLVYQQAVRAQARHPERLLAMPPSPAIPGWQAWVDPVGPHAIHAYGSLEQMQAVVTWYLTNTSGDLFITEVNFGAGNEVAVDRWATDHLRPFLDWLATEPRVWFCSYFAWRWRGAPPMPTPVDAAGTAVETVLRAWTPAEEEPVPVLTGIDLSNNNGRVDLGLVKAAGHAFVGIKASGDEGRGNVFLDGLFPDTWRQAAEYELVRLAYHYARPSAVTPAQSVTTLERAIQAVGGLKVGDSVALDIEDPEVPEGVSLHVWVAEWLALAESVFGVAPWRYSAHYYTSTHDLEHEDLARYPVWWASYQSTKPPPSPGWQPIRIWQNSASGRVPGIGGDVDTNLFEGSVADLQALGKPAGGAGGAGAPAVPPEVVSALDVLWQAVGPDEEAQRHLVAVKIKLGLQEK